MDNPQGMQTLYEKEVVRWLRDQLKISNSKIPTLDPYADVLAASWNARVEPADAAIQIGLAYFIVESAGDATERNVVADLYLPFYLTIHLALAKGLIPFDRSNTFLGVLGDYSNKIHQANLDQGLPFFG